MEHKISFLKNDLMAQLVTIPADRVPVWGKMNLQQMIEHLSRDAFRVASGKVIFPLMTPEEHILKMQEFLRSDKSFRENTVNKLLPEEPQPLVHQDMSAALDELQAEIDYFFEVYQQEPGKKVINPSFGEMDFELQVLLLHKHAIHHLRQFGMTIG
jgi:hypothetical protein